MSPKKREMPAPVMTRAPAPRMAKRTMRLLLIDIGGVVRGEWWLVGLVWFGFVRLEGILRREEGGVFERGGGSEGGASGEKTSVIRSEVKIRNVTVMTVSQTRACKPCKETE